MTTNNFMTPQLDGLTTAGTQKILNMIFIVDTSGSMRGDRIQAVNEAFTKMIPQLRQLQYDVGSEFELRIAIMRFDADAQWITTPRAILEYDHNDIPCSEWITYYSEAFKELNSKMTRSAFMAHTGKIAAPYIMFMTDGEPTPGDPYEVELDNLLGNKWFTNSQRFAVLIGSEAINSASARAAVSKFVTDPDEGIVNADDAVTIAKEVQAKTMHTVVNMTKHKVTDEEIYDPNLGGGNNGGGNSSGGDGGNNGGWPWPTGTDGGWPTGGDGGFPFGNDTGSDQPIDDNIYKGDGGFF